MWTYFGQDVGPELLIAADALLLRYLPEFKEHYRKAEHRFAPQHDGGILPMAVGRGYVDIFIGQIDAAGKGGLAVDDHYLSVVTVVLYGRHKWAERVEHMTFYPHRRQL